MSTTTTIKQGHADDFLSFVSHPDGVMVMIRLASAIAFLYHGSQILFGAFSGPGVEGFSEYMHFQTWTATLVGLAEFGGGLAMATGLFTRIGAACIAIVMLGAIVLVHLPHGYSVADNGIEYPLTQLIIALAVLVGGPGRYSIGARISNKLGSL